MNKRLAALSVAVAVATCAALVIGVAGQEPAQIMQYNRPLPPAN